MLAFPFDAKSSDPGEGQDLVFEWIEAEIPEINEINRHRMQSYWLCLMTNQIDAHGFRRRSLNLIPRNEWRLSHRILTTMKSTAFVGKLRPTEWTLLALFSTKLRHLAKRKHFKYITTEVSV